MVKAFRREVRVAEYIGRVSSSSKAFGIFVDARNGMVYKTIEVGEKVWMAAEWDALKIAAYCHNMSFAYALISTTWSKDATDCVGFGALPAGTGNGSFFEGEGLWTKFWTAQGEGDLYADDFHLAENGGESETLLKHSLLSVRCVRD